MRDRSRWPVRGRPVSGAGLVGWERCCGGDYPGLRRGSFGLRGGLVLAAGRSQPPDRTRPGVKTPAKLPKRKRVATVKDVAAELGLSVATVSRAISKPTML